MARRRGRPKHPDILTPREWEVLELLRDGLSNEEIARRLGISLDGAKYHVSEILGKLGLENRADAARWQPEGRRPSWTSAFAPLLFWRGRAGGLSLAIAGGLALVIAAGLGVLVWALVATDGEDTPQSSLPPGQPGLILDQPGPLFWDLDFVSEDEGWMLAGGGLLHSEDGGQTWVEIARLSGTAMDLADSEHGWIVGQSGAIHATTDGGRTWSKQKSGVDIHLSDVFAVSPREAWAVGSREGFSHLISFPLPTVMLHTTDSGASWHQIDLPAFSWFQNIQFVGESGWALGSTCEPSQFTSASDSCGTSPSTAVLHTSNRGHDWELLEASVPDTPRMLIFVDESRGWLAAECEHETQECSSGIFRTTDGGQTWAQAGPAGYTRFAGMDFRSDNRGWVAGWRDCDEGSCPLELLTTSNGGSEWKRIGTVEEGPSGYPSQLMSNGDSIYLIGNRLALRSTDGGETLEPMEHPAVALGDIRFVNERVGYSLGAGGLSRTNDGGQTWFRAGSELQPPAALEFLDEEEGYVAVAFDDRMLVRRTEDGGRSWTDVSSMRAAGYPRTLRFLGRHAWLRTDEGLLFSDNAGHEWEEKLSGEIVAVEPVSAQEVWALLLADISSEPSTYEVLYTADGGESWDVKHIVQSSPEPMIDFVSPQEGWVTAPGSDVIYRTSDGGGSWSETTIDDARIQDIAFTDALRGWMSVTACRAGTCIGQLLRTADGGETWTEEPTVGSHWGDLIAAPSGAVWLQPRALGDAETVPIVEGRTLLYRIE